MAKIDFYKIDNAEKSSIFKEIATQKGMKPFAVEKDWWVSRTLEIIFNMPIAEHLVFKGGTSLSKAWKLINRFSEDIDLAIDKEFFGFTGDLGKNKRDKLKKISGAYTTGTFFQELKHAFELKGFKGLNFVVVEAKDSDKIFAEPLFKVPTVNPERTFLEKLFLLHEEFHRPVEKMRVDRLSRHLYDIFYLTQAGIATKAFSDKELYETIVAHRYKFSRVGDVDYNLHHPNTLNPIPAKDVIAIWEADYAKMKEDMIYEEKKPSFLDLTNNLHELRTHLQAVKWNFELIFPKLIH